jgi:hypothetical protein
MALDADPLTAAIALSVSLEATVTDPLYNVDAVVGIAPFVV